MEQDLLRDGYHIRYVDAHYSFETIPEHTNLNHHEAYGYVTEANDQIVIAFIKSGDDTHPYVHEGMILPSGAIISRSLKAECTALHAIPINSRIAVSWRDLVHFKDVSRTTCSVMQTEGILHRKEPDHIIIKDPDTIRKEPQPSRPHPEGRSAAYYAIPVSFITHINAF